MKSRILVIDDDEVVREFIKSRLTLCQSTVDSVNLSKKKSLLFSKDKESVENRSIPQDDFEITVASSGESGIIILRDSVKENYPFQLVFIDIRMPGMSGDKCAKLIRELDYDIGVCFISGYSDRHASELVSNIGGSPDKLLLLKKPFDSEEIKQIARAMCAKWHYGKEREQAFDQRRKVIKNLEREISERKSAENRLNTALEELKRSNYDLERFAYIATHDLQEPLRAVASFSQLLSRRYKGKLDDQADEFISYIVNGAEYMHNMINDLLTYSRVSFDNEETDDVDCQKLVGDLLTNLHFMIKESNAEITCGSLPVINASISQIELLFRNLIGNAIKYRGKEIPQIHISARKENNSWLFSIKDNGIGIDKNYLEQIFVVFKRLHGKDKYSGTGIGLSLCKRIVELNQGKIWVQSELEKGSTFFFTVPVSKI